MFLGASCTYLVDWARGTYRLTITYEEPPSLGRLEEDHAYAILDTAEHCEEIDRVKRVTIEWKGLGPNLKEIWPEYEDFDCYDLPQLRTEVFLNDPGLEQWFLEERPSFIED